MNKYEPGRSYDQQFELHVQLHLLITGTSCLFDNKFQFLMSQILSF